MQEDVTLSDHVAHENTMEAAGLEAKSDPKDDVIAMSDRLDKQLSMEDRSGNLAQLDEATERKFRRSEKQRDNRRAKRARKRDEPVNNASQAVIQEVSNNTDTSHKPYTTRHQPSPKEHSMIFFMKMQDWSLHLQEEAQVSGPNSGGKLDADTAEAMSRVVRRSWLGDGAKRYFQTTEGLDHFTAVKSKEVAYIEKQLRLVPAFDDSIWLEYYAELESRLNPKWVSSDQVMNALERPARFLQDTHLPCLKEQARILKEGLKEARELQRKYEALENKYEHQNSMRAKIHSLAQDKLSVLPLCPVWTEVGVEIEQAQNELMDPKELLILSQRRKETYLAYKKALTWP